MNIENFANISEDNLLKYDLLFIDAEIRNLKIKHNNIVYYHKKPLLFNDANNISPANIAKIWFDNMNIKIDIEKLLNEKNYQIEDIQIIFNDNIKENEAISANNISNNNIANSKIRPCKKLYLIGDQNIDIDKSGQYHISIDNSFTQQCLMHSGQTQLQVQIFGQPSAMLYEYLFYKFKTKNILSITSSLAGAMGAKLNNIEYVLFEQPINFE